MKVKEITVGIKELRSALDEFVAAGEAMARGETVAEESGIYFTSMEAFRKALTPKRLELIHVIRTQKPSSINQLAKLAGRNIKNVAEDVKFLAQVGLVETTGNDRAIAPRVDYEEIRLKIAV